MQYMTRIRKHGSLFVLRFMSQYYWMRPIANGLVRVDTDDPAMMGCDIRLEEQGNHVLSMVAISRKTGKSQIPLFRIGRNPN